MTHKLESLRKVPKRLSHRLLLVVIVTFAALLISGCSSEKVTELGASTQPVTSSATSVPPTWDPGSRLFRALVDGLSPNCELPCWHNFRPGQSTLSEMLNDDLFQKNVSKETPYECAEPDTTPEFGVIRCVWEQSPVGSYEASIWVDFWFDADSLVLQQMWLWAWSGWSAGNAPLSFVDLAEFLGPPEFQHAVRGGLDLAESSTCDCSFTPTEVVSENEGEDLTIVRFWGSYDMLYPKMGVIAGTGAIDHPGDYWPCLCQDMTVGVIYIQEPKVEDQSLEDWYFDSFLGVVDPWEDPDQLSFSPFSGWGTPEPDN